jgi:hypothetical protein
LFRGYHLRNNRWEATGRTHGIRHPVGPR